jgi:hypothetical protein
LIFVLTLQKIKAVLLFIIFSYLVLVFLLLFDLFEMIYKIGFFFNFIPFNIFYLSDLVLILLIDICFIWDYFLKFIFLRFHPFKVFFFQFDPRYFICYVFFPWKCFLDWSPFLRFHAPWFNLLIIELLHWAWI